jgi:uncharacterized protein YcbK (DUF882 family)
VRKRATLSAVTMGVIIAVQLYEPPGELMASPPVDARRIIPVVTASGDALGSSGDVQMRFVRAGERVAFPLEFNGNAYGFRYQWVRAGSTEAIDVARPYSGDTLLAPLEPGVYELQMEKGGTVQRIGEPRLAVLVPFELKLGSKLNGYRIGRYPSERGSVQQREGLPDGFLEVHEEDVDLPLTRHLRVSDFLTHDAQTTWPRYVAIDPRVLDKIELVMREIARRRGADQMDFDVRVHSGYRTPLHNARVEGAARDSRHQYGDAADVAIDADGDGKLTIFDALEVERAVEWVERAHPELVGGLGVYSSRRYATPYLHIDARGERKRWRG